MKKKKRAKQFIAEKMGKKNYEEVRFLEKSAVNTQAAINPLAEWGNVRQIQNAPSLQMALYESGDFKKIEYFFEHHGCFEAQVQKRMIKDDNLKILDLFLKYWEFVPEQRDYMVRCASIEFVRHYLQKKSLGKQAVDVPKNGRFSRAFISEIYTFLTEDAQKLCHELKRLL